jgi:hypothetical protein
VLRVVVAFRHIDVPGIKMFATNYECYLRFHHLLLAK